MYRTDPVGSLWAVKIVVCVVVFMVSFALIPGLIHPGYLAVGSFLIAALVVWRIHLFEREGHSLRQALVAEQNLAAEQKIDPAEDELKEKE